MKRLAIVVILITIFFTVVVVGLSSAQDGDSGVIVISVGDYHLEIVRVWRTDKAGFERPDEDLFLIMEIVLHNTSEAKAVFYGGDFPLHIEPGDFEPRNMKEVRNEYYEGRDYPGFTNGQPVDGQSSEPSLLVYDLPAGFTSVELGFNPGDSQSSVTLHLSLLENGDYLVSPEISVAQAPAGFEVRVSTFTPTPLPTITPIPTATPRASITPPSTATPRSLPTTAPTTPPQTRYVTAQTINVRACIGTDCTVVTQLSYDDSFTAIGQGEDADGAIWYSFRHGAQTVWIAGWLTSTQRPAAAQPQPPAQQPPAQQPPAQQQPTTAPAAVPPVAGAAPSCLVDFDFSVCSSYYPAPANCDEVVARGIPARVAACCFPDRDRDQDGYACYGE